MIGNKIKKYRIERGYTLSELEKKSGVSYVQISRYEKNKARPTSKVIKRLSEALKIDVSMLVPDVDDVNVIDNQKLYNLFDELMSFIKENEEDKYVLSKMLEVMLFKEKTKSNLIDSK